MNKIKKIPIYLKVPLYFLGSIFMLVFSFLLINKIGIEIFALKYSGLTSQEVLNKACIDTKSVSIIVHLREASTLDFEPEKCSKRVVFLQRNNDTNYVRVTKKPTIPFLSYYSYAEFYYKNKKMHRYKTNSKMLMI